MEAIKYYVKGAFLGIAETPEVLEQQEELIADLKAKVEDLVADGRSEEEALGMAIASMGDLSGLVREFVTDEPVAPEPTEKPVSTVEAYTSKLRLHAVVISAGVAIAALFVISLFAIATDNLRSVAGVWDLFWGFAGVMWMAYALWRFHERPDAVGVIELGNSTRLRRALLQWAGVCVAALFLNAALGSEGFWAWTVWIAAAAWPASIYLEQWLLKEGKFLYTEAVEVEPPAAAAVNGSCA